MEVTPMLPRLALQLPFLRNQYTTCKGNLFVWLYLICKQSPVSFKLTLAWIGFINYWILIFKNSNTKL